MSKPRYKWWGYVKWCIRDYPVKCEELTAMRSRSAQADGAPHAYGASRTTENVAMRGFAGQKEREYVSVAKAIELTRKRTEGGDILKLIDLVFWRQTHSLQGAAMECHISQRTAERWHGDFIRLVARSLGLLDS